MTVFAEEEEAASEQPKKKKKLTPEEKAAEKARLEQQADENAQAHSLLSLLSLPFSQTLLARSPS